MHSFQQQSNCRGVISDKQSFATAQLDSHEVLFSHLLHLLLRLIPSNVLFVLVKPCNTLTSTIANIAGIPPTQAQLRRASTSVTSENARILYSRVGPCL